MPSRRDVTISWVLPWFGGFVKFGLVPGGGSIKGRSDAVVDDMA